MRIALVSPLMEAVPPRTYGGTERVVANLADALTAEGHHVTVFANGESRVNADLVVCRDRSILTDERRTSQIPDHILMLDRLRQVADRFDVLHFHTEFLHFPMFEDIAERTLTTCHSRLDFIGHRAFFRRYRRFPLVSISEAQRLPLAEASWIATVPHGIPPGNYRVLPRQSGDTGEPYLAFLGRIAPDKGIDTAIEIARRAGIRLKIAARINSFDRPYWEETIKPRVDGDRIAYMGEIRDDQKTDFLGRAHALVFPIRWPEPFGLVMIEAMACGTPVIAFPFGAVPEVIDDRLTGRIVDGLEAAVDAVAEVGTYDRSRIRARFEDRFSSRLMAQRYVQVYRRLLAGRPSARPSSGLARRGIGGVLARAFDPAGGSRPGTGGHPLASGHDG
jgi:glycosyltransferase involved in cell wall biosynthesis